MEVRYVMFLYTKEEQRSDATWEQIPHVQIAFTLLVHMY